MAESNGEPPLCPCGFWGSPQTGGLCSKCFKELSSIQQPATQSSSCQIGRPATSAPSVPCSSNVQVILSNDDSDNCDQMFTKEPCPQTTILQTPPTQIQSTSNLPVSEEVEQMICAESDMPPPAAPVPIQTNKRRCYKCCSKLDIATITIGKCQCGLIFCHQHRLPEQHDCTFNFKEHGRREARDKMVSPRKYVGVGMKRLDQDDNP